MSRKLNISEDLKQQYFWDADITRLDAEKSKKLIIERVFSLGNSKEINLITDYYGRDIVIEVLKNLNYMDPKNFNFVTKLFNVSSESFKCYRHRQLNPTLWNS